MVTSIIQKLTKNSIDGLMQERHNSSALAMELHLSCINLSIYDPDGNTQGTKH